MSDTELSGDDMRALWSSLDVGKATHVGRVRRENEDSLLALGERGIFAVADGMGGHVGGKQASTLVVNALAHVPAPASLHDFVKQCAARVHDANALLLARAAQSHGEVSGSTLALLVAYGERFACLWAGDSRAYVVRDREIAQISRDHNEAQELVAQGIITREEARRWPRRNVITRAVGVYDDMELEVEQGDMRPGDTFVLCSDGLTNHVEDSEICDIALNASPQQACDALVELTLERGASDNVSVVVVHRRRKGSTVVLPEGLPGPVWS